MWLLMMKPPTTDWHEDGKFENLSAAARRIREIEGRPMNGVFLQAFAEIDFGTDDEFLGHLEYTGQQALYVIKRRRPN